MREERLRLGSSLRCVDVEERVPRFLERLLTAVVAREMECSRSPNEEIGTLGVALGPELECLAAVLLGGRR